MDQEQRWECGMAGGMPDGSAGGSERMAGAGRTASDDQQENDIDQDNDIDDI